MKDDTASGIPEGGQGAAFSPWSMVGFRGCLQRLPRLWGQGRQGCVLQPGLRRSLCWASVCPSACLSAALKEAGAGPAAAWAELLLRGTRLAPLSGYRVSTSHHFPEKGKTLEV